jgi:hypothetical protein
MIDVELSDEEREILKEVLESTLSDLRAEIAVTERLAWRDMLKVRRDLLARVIVALDAS